MPGLGNYYQYVHNNNKNLVPHHKRKCTVKNKRAPSFYKISSHTITNLNNSVR